VERACRAASRAGIYWRQDGPIAACDVTGSVDISRFRSNTVIVAIVVLPNSDAAGPYFSRNNNGYGAKPLWLVQLVVILSCGRGGLAIGWRRPQDYSVRGARWILARKETRQTGI
jgi:hypothetical protein